MRGQLRLAFIALGVVGFGLILLLELQRRPGYFANSTYLGAIIAIEVVLACLWRFETVFFPVTMYCFLAAATALPFAVESFTIRWLFLGVGALVRSVIWIKRTELNILEYSTLLRCSLCWPRWPQRAPPAHLRQPC